MFQININVWKEIRHSFQRRQANLKILSEYFQRHEFTMEKWMSCFSFWWFVINIPIKYFIVLPNECQTFSNCEWKILSRVTQITNKRFGNFSSKSDDKVWIFVKLFSPLGSRSFRYSVIRLAIYTYTLTDLIK